MKITDEMVDVALAEFGHEEPDEIEFACMKQTLEAVAPLIEAQVRAELIKDCAGDLVSTRIRELEVELERARSGEWSDRDYGAAADALEACYNDLTLEDRARAVLDAVRPQPVAREITLEDARDVLAACDYVDLGAREDEMFHALKVVFGSRPAPARALVVGLSKEEVEEIFGPRPAQSPAPAPAQPSAGLTSPAAMPPMPETPADRWAPSAEVLLPDERALLEHERYHRSTSQMVTLVDRLASELAAERAKVSAVRECCSGRAYDSLKDDILDIVGKETP